MKKIKIVWDFYGDKSLKTAEHHVVHLLEYMDKNKISVLGSGVESGADFHHMAYVTLTENDVTAVKHQLKPHRAFLMG